MKTEILTEELQPLSLEKYELQNRNGSMFQQQVLEFLYVKKSNTKKQNRLRFDGILLQMEKKLVKTLMGEMKPVFSTKTYIESSPKSLITEMFKNF